MRSVTRGSIPSLFSSSVGLLLAGAGCGSSSPPDQVDAGPDATPDAGIDGPPACTPTVLLAGGTDVAAQGWTIVMLPPAALTYGADYTRIETTTNASARTGGQMLLRLPNAVEVDQPFQLQLELMVESVSRHNQLDAGAAILGSFTPPFGVETDRRQMIYLDSAALGWSDDSASFAAAITNGTYHTYVLSVDAAKVATLTIDGAAALTRAGFAYNGGIAVGDQTNDPNVDSAMRIRKITKLCL